MGMGGKKRRGREREQDRGEKRRGKGKARRGREGKESPAKGPGGMQRQNGAVSPLPSGSAYSFYSWNPPYLQVTTVRTP